MESGLLEFDFFYIGGSICTQIVWKGIIICEFIWIYFFFQDKLQINYFLTFNSRTKGNENIYLYIQICLNLFMQLIAWSHLYHSMHFYKYDNSEDVRIRRVCFIWCFFGVVYALKLMQNVLICDVQHPFPYQTKGLEETWSPVQIPSDCQPGFNQQGIHPMATIRIYLW